MMSSTPAPPTPAPPSSISPSPAADWEVQLLELRAENAELQRRHADAEKDRDLFRDLYGKASAHASAVSAENNELSERAALAEGQAREGVAMLKATYEERVRLLELARDVRFGVAGP